MSGQGLNADKTKTSSCDDALFMASEITVGYNPSRRVKGITLDVDLQSGKGPAFLRKWEIKALIDNLQYFYDKLK